MVAWANQAALPRWMYVLGAAALGLGIYVWQAPVDGAALSTPTVPVTTPVAATQPVDTAPPPPTTLPSTTTTLAAGVLLSPAATGLPEQYVTDRGLNYQYEERKRTMRADLRDYALAVRAADPALADRVGWALQTIPWSVCVLGPHLRGGWEAFVDRAHAHVAALTVAASNASRRVFATNEYRRVPTGWVETPTARNDASVALMYDMARDLFCPADGGPARGDPSEHLPGWQRYDFEMIDDDEQWMERQRLPADSDMRDVSTAQVGSLYAVTAALPALTGWSAAVFSCFSVSYEYQVARARTPAPSDRWSSLEVVEVLTFETVERAVVDAVNAVAQVDVGCPSARRQPSP